MKGVENMKTWKKPTITELKASQLAKYIEAAARSYQCLFGEFR